MTLKNFIQQLQKVAGGVDADKTEVQMADEAPMVKPVFKDGVIYITDKTL